MIMDPSGPCSGRLRQPVLHVDLDALADNYARMRGMLPYSECAAVVKANAYGIGMVDAALALFRAGCRSFYVASLDEGAALRSWLPEARIFVLSGLQPGVEHEFWQHRLVPVLNDLPEILVWSRLSATLRQTLSAVIHIDTGMNRLGLDRAGLFRLYEDWSLLGGIDVLFYMSHLSCAADPESPVNHRQRSSLVSAVAGLPNGRLSLANSPGVFLGPDFHFDQVRVGRALYGIVPAACGSAAQAGLRDPLRLCAPVVQVRSVVAGSRVGYEGTGWLSRDSTVATVGIGFADGMTRALAAKGYVSFGGYRLPIVGRPSMDLIMVDATDVPSDLLSPGSPVEIFGPDRPIRQVSHEIGISGSEILAGLGSRVARSYTAAQCELEDAAD